MSFSKEDQKELAEQLEKNLMTLFVKGELFESARIDGEKEETGRKIASISSKTMKIETEIKEMRKVNGFERVMLGVMSGQGKVVTLVTLSDETTGRTLAVFEVEGKTANGGIAIKDTTTEGAVKRVAEQIAGYIFDFQ